MPASIWLKTHIEQKGPFIIATTGMVGGATPEMFVVKVDIRPFLKKILQYHKMLHQESIDGCVGCDDEDLIGLSWSSLNPVSAAKKLAKSKAVRTTVSIATKANPITLQASLAKKALGATGLGKSKTAKMMLLATNPLAAQAAAMKKIAKSKTLRSAAMMANPLTLQALAAQKIATDKNVRKRVTKALVASNPYLAQIAALKKSGELAKRIATRKQKLNKDAFLQQVAVLKELASSTNGSKAITEAMPFIRKDAVAAIPIAELARVGKLSDSRVAQYIKVAHPGALQADLMLKAIGKTSSGKKLLDKITKKLPSSKLGLLGAAAINPLAAQAAVLAKKANREKIKKAVRNPYVAAGVAAAAVAYPPVGVPAAEALAKANATIETIEQGEKMAAKLKALSKGSKELTTLKRSVKGKSKAEVIATFKSPAAMGTALRAVAARRVTRKIARSPSTQANIRKLTAAAEAAKTRVESLQNEAKYGTDSAKKETAQKAVAVLEIAANARAKLESIDRNMSPQAAQGQQGILITAKGPVRGKFIPNTQKTSASPDILMLALRSELGQFTRIGGECIGCGLLGF